MPDQAPRTGIIQVITSPLGFFALSLLIVEGFLTIVMIFSDIDASSKFLGMLIGAGLFAFVVFGVLLLVWFKPASLTYDGMSHLMLEMAKAKLWGTSEDPVTKRDIETDSTPATPASLDGNSVSTMPAV